MKLIQEDKTLIPIVDAIETEFGAHVPDNNTRERKQGLRVAKGDHKRMQTVTHVVWGVQLGKHERMRSSVP